jgi:hypothetical protein
MKGVGNPHLTGDTRVAVAGMAFFSGTGPAGAHCCDCLHVDGKSRRGGTGRCLKHRAMMRGKAGPAFELDTRACKYFEAAPRKAWPMSFAAMSGGTTSRLAQRETERSAPQETE